MYIDGFLLAVPANNKDKYRELAETTARIFRKHGAVRVMEGWEDDVPEGKLTSFPLAVKREEGENVVFSWILWPSRQQRDEGMKKSMDELHTLMPEFEPVFDGKRMIFGGFEALVDM